MELTADFQQLYTLQIEDLWTGELAPSRVLTRIEGLFTDPHSRFRAAWLEDHPPKYSDDAPTHLHWTPEAGLLAHLVNLTITQMSKRRPSASSLMKTPADRKRKTHRRFKTIRDFAEGFTRR